MPAKKSKKPAGKKRGPKPHTLKLEGDWESAIAKAVKRPPKPKQ